MNYSDWLEASHKPLYTVEGEEGGCPPGYKFDKKMMMCVPKRDKDKVGPNQKEGPKDLKPGNGVGYNVWGASGYDGSGYAFEEKPTSSDLQTRE